MGYHISLIHVQVLVLIFISNESFAFSEAGRRFIDALTPLYERCIMMQISEADLRELLGINIWPKNPIPPDPVPYPFPPNPVPYPFPNLNSPQSIFKALSVESLISHPRYFPPSRYPKPLISQDPSAIRWNSIFSQSLKNQPSISREWPDLMLKSHLQRENRPPIRREWPDLMPKPHLQRQYFGDVSMFRTAPVDSQLFA